MGIFTSVLQRLQQFIYRSFIVVSPNSGKYANMHDKLMNRKVYTCRIWWLMSNGRPLCWCFCFEMVWIMVIQPILLFPLSSNLIRMAGDLYGCLILSHFPFYLSSIMSKKRQKMNIHVLLFNSWECGKIDPLAGADSLMKTKAHVILGSTFLYFY